MAHPAFIIEKTKHGAFLANLTAKNGQVIFSTLHYVTKQGCKNGIESIKINSKLDERFVREESGNGECYFVLRAGNNQVIGQSEFYGTKASMERGIEVVKTCAAIAEIDDRTI